MLFPLKSQRKQTLLTSLLLYLVRLLPFLALDRGSATSSVSTRRMQGRSRRKGKRRPRREVLSSIKIDRKSSRVSLRKGASCADWSLIPLRLYIPITPRLLSPRFLLLYSSLIIIVIVIVIIIPDFLLSLL